MMGTTSTIGYQPTNAYQGETSKVNTPQQEPKSNQTQPREAAVADSQSSKPADNSQRGGNVNIVV